MTVEFARASFSMRILFSKPYYGSLYYLIRERVMTKTESIRRGKTISTRDTNQCRL